MCLTINQQIIVEEVLQKSCNVTMCDDCGGYSAFGDFPEDRVRDYIDTHLVDENIHFDSVDQLVTAVRQKYEDAESGCACCIP